MKNQTAIKNLTWKYFWEQKRNEIFKVLLILFIIWSVAGFFFQMGWFPMHETKECSDRYILERQDQGCSYQDPYQPWFPMWMMVSGIITTGMWILIGLYFWVKSNWKYATERAKEDLEKSKGGKKHGC